MRRSIKKIVNVASMLIALATPAIAGTIMTQGVKCDCLCVTWDHVKYCLCACSPPSVDEHQ